MSVAAQSGHEKDVSIPIAQYGSRLNGCLGGGVSVEEVRRAMR
jgi:hypothetical protein